MALIEHDLLGRVTHLAPTDAAKASTWLDYPDLRTARVYVEDPDAAEMGPSAPAPFAATDRPNLIARYAYDGLGRIRHAATKKEATS